MNTVHDGTQLDPFQNSVADVHTQVTALNSQVIEAAFDS
jgi:hypothetical protein